MGGPKVQEIVLALAKSRSDILKQVEGVSPKELTWRPGPEAWTIGQILAHIPYYEPWYLSQIEQTLGKGPGDWQEDNMAPEAADLSTVVADMEIVRSHCLARIERLSDEDLAVKGSFDEYGDLTVGELLGKMIEHEQEHVAHIADNRRYFRETK